MKRELGIARCGLACCLCSENVTCKGCKRDGFMELSWCKDAEWCEVRKCGINKNISGCYECEPAECRKGLYAEKIKPRAFAEFARRYGVEELLDCLERNERAGIVYHREGIMGDYDDFDDLEELISFIRTGKRNIELIPLLPEDKDITDLMRIHASPSVTKYISISENFFDYVTNTDKVIYYKILWNRVLTGGVHCEYADGTMKLSICIDEIYRRHGIAEAALNQLFLAQSNDVNVIEVSIDETNVPSLSLFQKLGFSQIGREDELITLRKLLC